MSFVTTPRSPRESNSPRQPLPDCLSDVAATPLQAAQARLERGTPFAAQEVVYDTELGEGLVHRMVRPKPTVDETAAAGNARPIRMRLRDGSIVARELHTVRPFALMLVPEFRKRVFL